MGAAKTGEKLDPFDKMMLDSLKKQNELTSTRLSLPTPSKEELEIWRKKNAIKNR